MSRPAAVMASKTSEYTNFDVDTGGANDAIDLDIAGVDLLFNNGSYTICEVNSAPGFEGMEKYTNKNIAVEMVNYVVKKIGG